MKILIVEDNKDILDFLKLGLKKQGFVVDATEDGNIGSLMAHTNNYDLIILDISLPNKNGDLICQEIRGVGKTVPIIMLTVETEVNSKVKLLNLGADDYLEKPFAFEELLARIRALLRRPLIIRENVLEVGKLTLDIEKQLVKYGEKDLHLTPKEFRLLEYLMRHKGELVSKISILENVWDSEVDLFSNAIETHMLNLRKKLKGNGVKNQIKTFSGRGYKIE